MKLAKKYLGFILLLTSFNYITIGAPADNSQIFSKKQTNGKIISYTLNGDEFISWATSLDGYTLLINNNGELVYAIKNKEGELVPSNVLATNYEERTIEDNIFLSSIKPGLFYSKTQLERVKQRRNERIRNKSTERIPTTGTPNFLVILVNFTDIAFDTSNVTIMKDQINISNYTTNNRTGSVKDYFFDNSMGNLNANFTVVGPYTLPHNQAYYGASTNTEHDILPQQMAYDAAILANNDVNFAQYDNDFDNYVDMVHIVYAGRGQHNGGGDSAIWAHSYIFPNNTSLDGVNFWSYSCSSELQYDLSCDGIGAICHEMGHVLGLPDFYDTDYEGSGGTAIHLGKWDLMAAGSYNNNSKTPPYLCGLERYILGWMGPIIDSVDNTFCTLPAISDSNKVYEIDLSPNEFYFIEHRNQKKWDSYILGKGMLIFHGDLSVWNNGNGINTNPYDRGFFIIPAVGDSSNIDSTNTTFPGSDNITSFTNSILKNGTPTGNSLINISYGADSIITFVYRNSLQIFSILPVTNITSNSATLNAIVSDTSYYSIGFEYRKKGDTSFISQNILSSPMQLNLSNLQTGTKYEFRVYATKNYGIVYSDIYTFQTNCGVAYLPFQESFESDLICWLSNSSNNQDSLSIVQRGSQIDYNVFPHSGENMLEFNSFSIDSGIFATITSPAIYFPHPYYETGIWMYRQNNNFSKPNEGIEIYINNTESIDGATLIGYIPNDRLIAPIENSDGWYNYHFNVPSNTIGENYIIIKSTSAYGCNIYIDDFTLDISSTQQVSSMVSMDSISTSTSTTFYGTYIKGTDEILSKGFEYKTTTSTTWDTIFSQTNDTHFSSSLTNLLQNTLYNVRAFTVTQTEGTTYSLVDTFLNQNISIRSIENNPVKMLLYPNPTTNITNLIIEGISDETKIIISDIQGRIINSNVANPINSKIIQKIDCSNLSKGVYFINITNHSINKTQKLIIK
ncbi:MAG: family metalloprotease domain protein [Bacteroidetes bacterium]|nr:family metalloprotease domain protein [Bacteroidota bacterium]